MSAITSELARLSGPLAYLVVAALVFGETALFFGFVLPGEIAVVLGGVLASRGRVSLPLLILVVVAAAIIGPLVGYEVGRRMGGRVVASRFLRRVSGTVEKAASALNSRGAVAVLVGRFTAVLRAMMPALAGTARMSRHQDPGPDRAGHGGRIDERAQAEAIEADAGSDGDDRGGMVRPEDS